MSFAPASPSGPGFGDGRDCWDSGASPEGPPATGCVPVQAAAGHPPPSAAARHLPAAVVILAQRCSTARDSNHLRVMRSSTAAGGAHELRAHPRLAPALPLQSLGLPAMSNSRALPACYALNRALQASECITLPIILLQQ